MTTPNSGARLATRLSFLVSGFGLACWAPLVPLAKERLAIGDGSLGLVLGGKGLLQLTQAGPGYSVFAVAMTAGRLSGDAIVATLADRRTMLWGGLLSLVGYAVMLLAPVKSVALPGFLLTGLGTSNVVPILFRQAGAQTVIPAGLAIASVTTIG